MQIYFFNGGGEAILATHPRSKDCTNYANVQLALNCAFHASHPRYSDEDTTTTTIITQSQCDQNTGPRTRGYFHRHSHRQKLVLEDVTDKTFQYGRKWKQFGSGRY